MLQNDAIVLWTADAISEELMPGNISQNCHVSIMIRILTFPGKWHANVYVSLALPNN
jgi:hypothetical protein